VFLAGEIRSDGRLTAVLDDAVVIELFLSKYLERTLEQGREALLDGRSWKRMNNVCGFDKDPI